MAEHRTETVIDVTPRTGLRGKLERLFIEYSTKAQALRIAAEIVDDDDRRNALTAAPTKFLAAMNQRNGANGHAKVEKQKRSTKNRKAPIAGKPMSLFLLEHLDQNNTRPAAYFVDLLAKAGSPVRDVRALNGPLGAALSGKGYAKRSKDGYRLTPKGATWAKTLRADLEGAGKIPAGGYYQPTT